MWDLKSKELAARRRLYEFVWCSNVDGKDVMKNHFLAIHCEVMMIVIGPRDQHIHHHPSSIHHLSDLLYIIHSFSWGEHALRINDDLQWFLCCCRYFHWNGHRNWCYSGAEWDGHVWVGGPKFAFTLPRKGEKDRKGMVLSFKSFNWDWPRTQEPKNPRTWISVIPNQARHFLTAGCRAVCRWRRGLGHVLQCVATCKSWMLGKSPGANTFAAEARWLRKPAS